MKKAKQILSLMLVIAMALGMMVFVPGTASAANGDAAKNVGDYLDADSIEYVEAVDVLSAVGVFRGDEDGTNFVPKRLVTREEAAVVMTYISIGKSAADRLGHSASSFTDVETDRWSNPYIEYCVNAGIIVGRGDGTFAPKDSVTASQMAKMLLVAIGYGARNEYTGDRWELNAIVDGQNREILDIDEDYTQPATREQVALYTFNALTKPNIVTYNSALDGYYEGDQIWGTSTVAQNLGNRTFSLVYKEDTDLYGYGTRQWKLHTKSNANSLTVPYRNDITLGTSAIGVPLKADGNGLTEKGSANLIAYLVDFGGVRDNLDNIGYYINGIEATYAEALAASGLAGAIVDLVDSPDPLTKLFDGHADKVVIIQKTPSIVGTNPTVDSAGTVTINGVYNKDGNSTFPKKGGEPTVVYPEDLKADDIVLFHTPANGVTYVEKAKSVTGTLTKVMQMYIGYDYQLVAFFGTGMLATTGLTHRDIAMDLRFAGYTAESLNFDIEATAYLDDGGSVICFVPVESVMPDYLAVLDATRTGYVTQAQVVLSNGSTAVVEVNRLITSSGNKDVVIDYPTKAQLGMDGSTVSGISTDFPSKWGHWGGRNDPKVFAYTIDNSGRYTLIDPATFSTVTSASNPFSPSNRSMVETIAYNATSTATISASPKFYSGANIVGDDNTVFIVEDSVTVSGVTKSTFRTYVGVKNAPKFDGSTYRVIYGEAATYTTKDFRTVAQFVYLIGSPTSAHKNIQLFVDAAISNRYTDGNEDLFEYTVIDLDATGAPYTKTLVLNGNAKRDLEGLMHVAYTGAHKIAEVTYTNGIVSAVNAVDTGLTPNAVTGFGTAPVKNGLVFLGGVPYGVNSRTTVYIFEPNAFGTHTVSMGTLGSIALDNDDIFLAKYSDVQGEQDILSEIYIQKRVSTTLSPVSLDSTYFPVAQPATTIDSSVIDDADKMATFFDGLLAAMKIDGLTVYKVFDYGASETISQAICTFTWDTTAVDLTTPGSYNVDLTIVAPSLFPYAMVQPVATVTIAVTVI